MSGVIVLGVCLNVCRIAAVVEDCVVLPCGVQVFCMFV